MQTGIARGLLLAMGLAASPVVIAQVAASDATPPPAAPAATDSAPSAHDWLDRMNAALVERRFSGTLVFFRDGQLDALQVEHRPDPQGAGTTRMASLSGEDIEVATDQQALRLRTMDGGSTWPVLSAGPAALPQRRPSPAHYELVLAGDDRIAGRMARVLDIRPRDGFRYGYRLWLDVDSALVLKALTIGPDGRAVEQLMFTELQVDPAAEQPSGESGGGERGAAQDASVEASGNWQVLDAPVGFRRTLLVPGPSTHLVFSDGVAFVSVYVEPMSTQQPTLSGAMSRGALNAFGRIAHGQQIIAIGEAPAATIERFAQGVVPASAGGSPTP